MDPPRQSPHLPSPTELKERIEAERAGSPFVVYRDEDGSQRIFSLGSTAMQFTIGRAEQCDVSLAWDPLVSSLHAELRRVGGQWVVIDDGLSRNGTLANGERVVGQRRLRDSDQLTAGKTMLIFREPIGRLPMSTAAAPTRRAAPELSPAQRRVLIALCRPFRDASAIGRPATNRQIADELVLTIAAVKTHLRALFERFGIEALPQNEKRARLVHEAIDSGTISPSELEP